jgi:hypothetical protein
MKIFNVVKNGLAIGRRCMFMGGWLNNNMTQSELPKLVDELNGELEPLFLHFGSLVREEAAKACACEFHGEPSQKQPRCWTCEASYLNAKEIRSVDLPALLEKMDEKP